MRILWMGLILLMSVIFSGASAAITISPDIIYQNTPVVISYTGFTDASSAVIGFEMVYTPTETGSSGLSGSVFQLPVTLDPGTFKTIDGSMLSSSPAFISDAGGNVTSGTYNVRVLKAIPGSGVGVPVNLSWMVNGTKKSGDASGQISFYPVFSPKQGYLNVTVSNGALVVSKLIQFNQNIIAPALTAEDVAVTTGETRYGNIALTNLPTGLSSYNLTMTLSNSVVGNFTGVQVPVGVTEQYKSITPNVLTVNATTSMAGAVNLPQALNISYLGVSTGTSGINLTVNSLKDYNGSSVSPVVITNGTLTTTVPPIPGAEFTGAPLAGIVPFNVSFLYLSPDNPTAFNWSFGDISDNSTDRYHTTHTYWIEGSHDVGLRVDGISGNYTNVKPGYVKARQVPVWFMANITSGLHPLMVTFNGSSSPHANNWVYSFGDGTSGFEPNMTHTYTVPGLYTVEAQGTVNGGTNSAIRNQYITVT